MGVVSASNFTRARGKAKAHKKCRLEEQEQTGDERIAVHILLAFDVYAVSRETIAALGLLAKRKMLRRHVIELAHTPGGNMGRLFALGVWGFCGWLARHYTYHAPSGRNNWMTCCMMPKKTAATAEHDVETLVLRAKNGDERAFDSLITMQYHFIFRVAYRVLGHKSDAEDVAQTVCMRIATAISSFNHRSSFSSWLYRITINAARDLQRSQLRRHNLVDRAAALTPEYAEAEQEAHHHVRDIWNAIRKLPEKQRDAVILVHGEGLSQEEAARIMSCQKVTVAWHLHYARKSLKDLL